MAWDARRPVPWKRLGMFLGLYAGVMLAVTLFTERDRIGNALISILVGVVIAATFLIVLTKFGWTMPILRSREEIARQRAERLAARGGSRSNDAAQPQDGPRPRPAPTSRTSTGPSQHRKKNTAKRR